MKRFVLTALLLTAATGANAQEATFTTSSLTPETALTLARAALKSCQDQGYQVTVAVVDRSGVVQVILRDRYAGPHTIETATRKAYTAVTFRTNSAAMMEVTQAGQPQSGIRHLPGVAAIGGGLMVEAGGQLVGGVGVSGAPGGDLDDICAKAGLAAVEDLLVF